ncbi:MAG: 6-phosphogluconolactonase [Ignavibacteria bacterium]|nr:MAG: 6-phosphogluconolactonase [Ignavibacteria bacterium]
MGVPATINVFKDPDMLALGTALGLCNSMKQAVTDRGVCSVALAGGDTPRRAYRLVAREGSGRADWNRIHFFFIDERIVPPDDPQSNFGMARRELLSLVPVPGSNIHRVRGEFAPERAAEEYRLELESFFAHPIPRFDLVLLGLGEDGHIASLFPGTAALDEEERSVVSVFVPKIKSWRVTLTLPVINNSREALFLVSGARKAAIVKQVLAAERPAKDIPATLVVPTDGKVGWMLDADAASLIGDQHRSVSHEHPQGKDTR